MPKLPVKINAGYSDKISKDYNSKSYSISLEMEVHINGKTTELEEASHRLFNLCKKIVKKEKGESIDDMLEPPTEATPSSLPPAPPQTTQVKLASEKQLKCVFAIAKSIGMLNKTIDALASRYNKNDLKELTSQEASNLIKTLKGGNSND